MPFGLRTLLEDRRWQFFAVYLGKVHPSLLKHPPLGHHPRTSTTSFRTIPTLLLKMGAAIQLLEASANFILEALHQRPGSRAGIGRWSLPRGIRGEQDLALEALKERANHEMAMNDQTTISA
jgi:hypothetical protein